MLSHPKAQAVTKEYVFPITPEWEGPYFYLLSPIRKTVLTVMKYIPNKIPNKVNTGLVALAQGQAPWGEKVCIYFEIFGYLLSICLICIRHVVARVFCHCISAVCFN